MQGSIIKTVKNLSSLYIVLLVAVAAAVIFWLYYGRSYGHLRVKVVDAYDLVPIEDAYVSVAEKDVSIVTDSSGIAYFQGVPLKTHTEKHGIPEKSWDEFTLICQRDGYRPSVLFHARIYESKVRRLTLYLFPEELDDTEIITMSESPDEEWTKELVNNYGR